MARIRIRSRSASLMMIRNAACDDADFLAWAILCASRGHLDRGWFDIALAMTESDCSGFLRRLVTLSIPSRWHYSRFLIAEAQGRAAATLCAYRAADAHPLSSDAINEALDASGIPPEEQDLVWERGAYQFTCTNAIAEDCWIIENVAVLPQFRGSGCTSALLERTINDARSLGLRGAQITFLIGNDSAERAYRKMGFCFVDDSRHPTFEATARAPGLRRYAMVL